MGTCERVVGMTNQTAYERLLDRLDGVRRNDSKASARCPVPAHDDKRASLSVAVAEQFAGVVAKCQVGCTFEDIMTAVKLTVGDGFDNPRDAQRGYTVTDEYPYHDETGKVLYVKERRWPKEFRQYVPLPGGGKQWNLNGVRRVLFGLPELRAAIEAGQDIYIAEGEKDAQALRKAGVAATTWTEGAWKPGASPKWRAEYTQQLEGAENIFLVQDRDDPGRITSTDIRAALLRNGFGNVMIMEPVKGKDVSDHLNAGHTLDELVPWWPPAQNQPPEGNQQPEEPTRRIRLTWANTITPRPVRWAWVHLDQGRIPSGHLVVVGGREGTGKSQFTLWLAAQVTHGTLPGELYGKPRRVIIVATEDSWKHTIVPRLIAAGADLGMVARADAVSETADNVTLSLPSDTSLLEQAITEHDVALVILDPVLSVLGDTINDHRAKDVRTALEPLVAVADRTGCLMVAIAHFNKGSGIDAATLISGSHAFRDLPRAVFAFAVTKTEKVLSQVKNTLGRSDLPSLTYTIEPVTVPTPEGDAEVSKFVLGGVSYRDVADLLADGEDADDPDLRNAAQDFILSYLMSNDLAAPASKVIAAGVRNGYTDDQIKKARTRMRDPKVLSRKAEFGGGWEWRLETSSDCSRA
jgi:hypothetical protein